MECEKIQNKLVDYLENNLPEQEILETKAHINSCKSCEIALQEMQTFLAAIPINKIEQPSQNLRTNFEQMLAEEKQLLHTKVVKLKPSTNWKSYLQIAASIALIVSAFFLGKTQQSQQFDAQVVELKNETLASKQSTILALMDNQSASKRIQGVQYVEEFSNLDPEIIEALVKRMLKDENTNVRLTAVNALQGFIASEVVKEGYIKALGTEKDPSIQITIIQLLVKIQEKKAYKPMQQLLEQEETQPFVKEEIKTALSTII